MYMVEPGLEPMFSDSQFIVWPTKHAAECSCLGWEAEIEGEIKMSGQRDRDGDIDDRSGNRHDRDKDRKDSSACYAYSYWITGRQGN